MSSMMLNRIYHLWYMRTSRRAIAGLPVRVKSFPTKIMWPSGPRRNQSPINNAERSIAWRHADSRWRQHAISGNPTDLDPCASWCSWLAAASRPRSTCCRGTSSARRCPSSPENHIRSRRSLRCAASTNRWTASRGRDIPRLNQSAHTIGIYCWVLVWLFMIAGNP